MSVHHSDTNQSNEYASTNLLSVLLAVPRVFRLFSALLSMSRVLPCACASSTALRAGWLAVRLKNPPLRRPFSRRESAAKHAPATAYVGTGNENLLEQGVAHGTFTRQISACRVGNCCSVGWREIVVAACLLACLFVCWRRSTKVVSVNVRVGRVASRMVVCSYLPCA